MSLTASQQARADALTAAAQLVPYPDNSTSPYETLLALADWILGDEPELSDPDDTPDLLDWELIVDYGPITPTIKES